MKITICCDDQELMHKLKKITNKYFFSIRRIHLVCLSKEELKDEIEKKTYFCDLLLMQMNEKKSDIKLIRGVAKCFPTYKLIGIGSEENNQCYPELFELNLLYYMNETNIEELLPRALKLAVECSEVIKDNCLICKSNHQLLKIPFDDITYIEREMHTTKVFTENNCYLIRRKLNELEDVLAKYPALIRCHMSFFVNCNHASAFGNKKFVMKNGDIIPVSRKYYSDVKECVADKYESLI